MAESPLKEKIAKDLISALKEKDEVRVSTLRLFLAGAHNREIEKKGRGEDPILTDDDTLEVLRKEAKKRKESIEIYRKGNRSDLADKEEAELKILESYLPARLDSAQVEKIIDEAIKSVNPSGAKDFGKVMSQAMKKLKGVADGGLVGKVIKERMEKSV